MHAKLVSELLGSAQTHLPSLGFTIEAIQAGARQSGIASHSTVSSLFPSSAYAARTLLEHFDQEYLKLNATTRRNRELRGKDEQLRAYEEAVEILENKLVATIPVKDKLPDAMAALVSSNSTPSLPISLPNPSAVLHRAYSITDEALHLAGWTGNLSMDWYTTRFTLTNSFLLSELHLISPDQSESSDGLASLQLYRRLSSLSRPKRETTMKKTFPKVEEWAKWGSQGWLGESKNREEKGNNNTLSASKSY